MTKFGGQGYLLCYSAIFLLVNTWNGPQCRAEVVIQDVLWTKEYDQGLDENYYGTCRFVESPCGPSNDTVCVQRGHCMSQGGSPNGDCHGGMGECCNFIETCMDDRTRVDVTQLVTNIQSPPISDSQCSFRFRRGPNICQIRLDFVLYNTEGANGNGECNTDQLIIRDSITVDRDFTTCGNLQGQHMYLTFGSEDYIEVIPRLRSPGSHYRIVATMIPCRSRHRAPDHCLQYFTSPTGMVQSFDYLGQQQNNQRYSICVKPVDSSSHVQWKPCSMGTGKRFDIVSNAQAVSHDCSTDWVQVKGLEKVCESFPELRSSWKPYDLLVNFDGSELPPPPRSFLMPVDPANCAAACISQPNAYTCACINNPDPTNQICNCVVDTALVPIQGDFNNTGFCLEYSQM